jgi:hypothetical protein
MYHRMTGTERIADALVVTQEAWVALVTMRDYGLLARTWRLVERVAPLVGRIVVVSYGDARDIEIGRSLSPTAEVVCNDRGDEPALFQARAPARVRDLLRDCSRVLIKTDQMWGGDVAMAIACELRGDPASPAARRVGIVARGGYHWSWTAARVHGADSAQAAQAGHIEGELCRAADVVQVTTMKIAFDLAWRFGLAFDCISVTPNYVVMPSQRESGPRVPGLILGAGRFSPEKRVDLLIRSIARLPLEQRRTVRMRLAGSGPCESAWKSVARDVGLEAHVEFVGRLPHERLLEEMSRCSVYAQLSEYEGHPKTVLEAMAMGAPVLVSDAPGMREHVADGRTGVVTSDDPESVAASLSRLLRDGTWATSLGTAAAAHARTAYSLDTIAPMEIEACRMAMARAMSGPRAGHAPVPPVSVRWDQPLLEATPLRAAQAFAESIKAYAKRLDEPSRAAFEDALMARIGTQDDTASRQHHGQPAFHAAKKS